MGENELKGPEKISVKLTHTLLLFYNEFPSLRFVGMGGKEGLGFVLSGSIKTGWKRGVGADGSRA